MDDRRYIVSVDLPHVGGAQNRRGRVVFEHGKSISRLSAVDDFKPFLFQCLRKPFGKEHIGIDDQDLGGTGGQLVHAVASSETSLSRSTTSITSSPSDKNPAA